MACTPHARWSAALLAASFAATAAAKDLAVDDAGGGFARSGLALTAEAIVHRGERLLLLRIAPTGVRIVERADGRAEAVSLADARLPYLPVRVDCGRITVRTAGGTMVPHAASPCLDEARLGHARALPAFVAFRYPAAGSVDVVVPVVIQERDPPVETTLRRVDAPPPTPSALLGPRTLAARVRVE